jgi:hypothetical protein
LGHWVYEFEKEEVMSGIQIAEGYMPGSLGRVAELHGTYYHKHWGFGLFFEAKVATELSEFLIRYDESREVFGLPRWTTASKALLQLTASMLRAGAHIFGGL